MKPTFQLLDQKMYVGSRGLLHLVKFQNHKFNQCFLIRSIFQQPWLFTFFSFLIFSLLLLHLPKSFVKGFIYQILHQIHCHSGILHQFYISRLCQHSMQRLEIHFTDVVAIAMKERNMLVNNLIVFFYLF